MFKMFSCLLLLTALLLAPSAPQQLDPQQTKTVDQRFVDLGARLTPIAEWLHDWKVLSSETQALILESQGTSQDREVELRDTLEEVVAEAVGVKTQLAELVKVAQATQNLTSQLLTDLQVLKGRQAVGGAVQGTQVFMFLAYLATITVFYLVRYCRKHQEKVAREEFELLETKLQASRSKRRAAAARASKQSPQ